MNRANRQVGFDRELIQLIHYHLNDTGLLLDNAQDLLKQPPLTESDLLRRFKVAIRDAHRYGLTSIHDAGLDPASLAFFKRFIFFPVIFAGLVN